MDMQKITSFMMKKEVFIGLGALLFVLIMLLIHRRSKIKKYKNILLDFQVRYNALKSIPLTFKLNKAVSLTKVDSTLIERVDEYKENFDSIHSNLKQIVVLLSDMEENILEGKLKQVNLNQIDLDGMLRNAEKDTTKLEEALNEILKQETEQRTEINTCKERFREIKNEWLQNENQLSFCEETIKERMNETEHLFTEFEEQMYMNDYQKANECVISIENHLNDLESILSELPSLLSSCRGIIPKQIDHVSENYSRAKQKGIYLQHLDIPRNLELISETLKQDLSSLRIGDCDAVSEHLNDYNTRLEQLSDQIERENKAYDEMKQLSENSYQKLTECHSLLEEITKICDKNADRYGFENIQEKITEFNTKNTEFKTVESKIKQLVEEYTLPASTILLSIKEFNQNVENQLNILKEMKNSVDEVRSDEDRAKKQLLKLHLIMNEIQVKIRCYRLPAVSDRYDGDLQTAYKHIRTIQSLLEEVPLNTSLLSSTLDETIDFVYKLYNNVNNIVGMAQMVENTIVFANKYRSSYSDIDSELTRAELFFRNGEYTQALTIAINAVEKLKVDSYEQRIKENATSAA